MNDAVRGYLVDSFPLKVSDPYRAAVASVGEHDVYRTWTGKIVDYAGRKIGRLSIIDTIRATDLELYGDRYWRISSNAVHPTDSRFGKEEEFRLECHQYDFG